MSTHLFSNPIDLTIFLCISDRIELVDLPDELILTIMKKVHPQVFLLCSMIDIGNSRLEKLAFDRCDSIDLTSDYVQAPHELFLKRFYSDVMPRISHSIESLTIYLHHIASIQNNFQAVLPNLRHLKIMLGAKYCRTGVPYTISRFSLIVLISFAISS